MKWILFCFLSTAVASYSLTDLALEYRSNLDLHIISNNVEKENWSLITGNHFASYYAKNTTPQINSSVSAPSNITNGSISDKELNNFAPSAKPDMLTSGQNLIPVKSLLQVESVAETVQIIAQISSSNLVQNNLFFPTLVVIWPSAVSEEEANTTLHTALLQQACKGFNIASEIIFGFPQQTQARGNVSTLDGMLFFEVFNINERHVVMKVDKGVLDFHCRNCKGVALRRSDFHGLTLNVSAMESRELNDDLHLQTTDAGDLVIAQNGFSARILQILQKSLNFTVKVYRASDWGKYVAENNSWVGSIKDVADGKANLGIAITFMGPARAQLVSFLPVADDNPVSAFFRTPDLNAVRDIFARPFQADLWAAVFATWIVLAFFMIFFSVIRKRYDLHNVDGQTEPDFTHDSFIWALATACQQGWDDHPVAGSLRTIFISGSFTGVVAYAGYSAAIVSTLSLRVDPIQNTEQLLKSSLKIGFREGFTSELLNQNVTNDIFQLYQEKLKFTKESWRSLNITEGYQHVLKESYAFISTRDNMYDNLKVTTNHSDICLLKELQILKRGFPLGHFTTRNSPFKEFLRYIYVTIWEPGISYKLRGDHTYKRRCLEASDNTGNALGFNDVFTAFMILSGGYFLSMGFLMVEKLLRHSKPFSYIR